MADIIYKLPVPERYNQFEPTKNTSPKIKYIPRNNGSTSWILKGAIINENVIIVCKDGACKRDLQRKYIQMKRQFYLEMTGSEPSVGSNLYPKFLTLNEYDIGIRGHIVPIVFDNSCFF